MLKGDRVLESLFYVFLLNGLGALTFEKLNFEILALTEILNLTVHESACTFKSFFCNLPDTDF